MKRKVNYLILLCLVFICPLTLNIACKKKQQTQNVQNNPVPNVPVNITIYPNDPSHFQLQSVGGWVYEQGGVNGIIIYKKSQQEFIVLERTSSYLTTNPNAKAIVQIDNFTLKDTVSKSKWQIIDGTVIGAPATWPLRLYRTSYDGNVLKIFN